MKYKNKTTEQRSCRERLKWAAVIVAIFLLAVAVAAACTQGFKDGDPFNWFGTKDEQAEVADNLIVSPAEEQGVSLAMRTIARDEYDDYGIAPTALSAQTITATVKDVTGQAPEALQKVSFAMAWASENEEAVTDYVTMETTDNTATFSCLKAFGTQIVVTVQSVFNEEATARITLDYVKGFAGYGMIGILKDGEGSDGETEVGNLTAPFTTNDSGKKLSGWVMFSNMDTKVGTQNWHYNKFWFPLTSAHAGVRWRTGTVENSLKSIDVTLQLNQGESVYRTFCPGSVNYTIDFSKESLSDERRGSTSQHFGSDVYSDTDVWSQYGLLYHFIGDDTHAKEMLGATYGALPTSFNGWNVLAGRLNSIEEDISVTLVFHPEYGAEITFHFFLDVKVADTTAKSLEVDHSGLLFYQ